MTTTRAASAAIAFVCVVGCGGAQSHVGHSAASAKPAGTTASPPSHRPPARPRPPGSLPQTTQMPSASTPGFHAEVAALWRGVRTGSLKPAMQAFFPEGAYAQVKAIADPRADYAARLVHDYGLDIAAAHALVLAHPGAARLVGVQVHRAYAHWVDPGACFNRVGYYEVPNSRLVYSQGGGIRSVGIASMISWRGVWYVVHLGAVTRAADQGVVDDPSVGAGTPTPSATC